MHRHPAHYASVERDACFCPNCAGNRQLDAARRQIAHLTEERDKALAHERFAEKGRFQIEQKLREVRDAVNDLESDVRHARESKQPAKGMTVPWHGPYASATPSVLKDLDRLVERFRTLLTESPGP